MQKTLINNWFADISKRVSFGNFIQYFPSAIVLLYILPFFAKVIFSPNSYLLITGSDGIKNYYTYAYYIFNGCNIFEFNGMNYPYGESIFYTDGQPIISFFFMAISKILPGTENFAVPFLNLIIVLSPVISAFILFKIFKKLGIISSMAVTAAIGISLLAPQFHRFASHLALSYSFFIPILIYYLIPVNNNVRFARRELRIGLFVLIAFLVHAYLGMILAFLTGLFCFFWILIDFNKTSIRKSSVLLFIGSVLPTLIFFVLISLSDSHTGRNTNPSGFFTYMASVYTVFLQSEPFAFFKFKITPNWNQWEGWAYIGFLSVFLVFPSLLLLVIKSFIKSPDRNVIFLLSLTLAAISALLFSFTFPFNMGHENWIEIFPIIKKFRSVGRFAWLFYYASGIITIWFLNYYARSKILKVAFSIIPLLYLIESVPVYRSYSKFVDKTPNIFNKSLLDSTYINLIEEINKGKYQAILPLPFFHIGSENYGKSAETEIYKESMIISFHTKLPLFATYLTHTSIWESKNIMQILAPPYYQKPIVSSVMPEIDILVYCNKNPISTYERNIVERSYKIFENELGTLYRITPSKLFGVDMTREFREYLRLKDSIGDKNVTDGSVSENLVLYNSFNSLKRDTVYFGLGAYYGYSGKYNLLACFDSGLLQPNNTYVLSYWKYNNGPNYGQGVLNALCIVTENKNWLKYGAPKISPVIDGNWSMMELEFQPQKDKGLIEIYEVDYAIATSGTKSIIDELIIYKKGSKVYKEILNEKKEIIGVFINNHPVMRDNVPYFPEPNP
ncbi:MAG: hypothetical protein KGZ82_09935 [Bacteroidales bacterium]|nr:hypothetical protein [Bacteroidales bacterium]